MDGFILAGITAAAIGTAIMLVLVIAGGRRNARLRSKLDAAHIKIDTLESALRRERARLEAIHAHAVQLRQQINGAPLDQHAADAAAIIADTRDPDPRKMLAIPPDFDDRISTVRPRGGTFGFQR
jgi:hypothetical protein